MSGHRHSGPSVWRGKEESEPYPDAPGMLSKLLSDHESVIRQLRKDREVRAEPHKDMGTSDIFTELMEKHENRAWILRAFLM